MGYFCKYSVYPWKECVFCYYWVECSRNVIYVKLIDSIVQVFYTLTGFLSTFSINYWEMGVEISAYNCGFAISAYSFISFRFMYFKTLLLSEYSYMFWFISPSPWIYPFIIMKWPSIVPGRSFCSEIYFVPLIQPFQLSFHSF